MTISHTDFPGLLIIIPNIFQDERGYFYESYNRKTLRKEGLLLNFVQDNQAKSGYGIIRGLHYQLEPYAQTKLVRAVSGTILDVAVDLRQGSPTFGKVFSVELSEENHKQLLIPRGFAHGYSVLSEEAVVQYKCDAYYDKEHEGGIAWNDPELEIDWKVPAEKAFISVKDNGHPGIRDCENNFIFSSAI